MKRNYLWAFLFFCLSAPVFAVNVYEHPQVAEQDKTKSSSVKRFFYPDSCIIQIINTRNYPVKVWATYEDGFPLEFHLGEYNSGPQYNSAFISLRYAYYCHAGMEITIQDLFRNTLYSGWHPVNQPIIV